MTTSHTKYAVDLSNEGMALWKRDNDNTWQLLGKLSIDAPNLVQEVEQLKNGYIPDANGKLFAQVRIPRSEVFVSKMDLEGRKDGAARSKVNDFLQKNTPYKAKDLLFDLENTQSNNDAYIAAVAKTTIDEAKSFIASIGFKAQFYTTKIDKAEFPRQPKFYDEEQQKSFMTNKIDSKSKLDKNPELDDVPPPPKPIKENSSQKSNTLVSKTDTDSGLIKPLPETLKAKIDPAQPNSSKELTAPNKKTPALSQTSSPLRQNISVEPSKPVKIEPVNGSLLPSNDIKMPQGSGVNTDALNFLKPRYILSLVALTLLLLTYWFYTVIFDGKDEIAQLNEVSDIEPQVITAPSILAQNSPTDYSPRIIDSVTEKETKTTISSPPVLQPLSETQTRALQILTLEEDVSATIDKVLDIEQAPDQSNETINNRIELTQKGVVGDEGITIYAGSPDIIPPTRDALNISEDPLKSILPKLRSREFEQNYSTTQEIVNTTDIELETPEFIETNANEPDTDLLALADPSLKSKPPKFRPSVIGKKAKETNTSLLASANPTLANIKPKRRPSNLNVPVTAQEPKKVNAAEINIAIQQAVENGLRPRSRPKSLANKAAKTKAAAAKEVEKEAIQTAALTPAKAKGTAKASSPTAVNIQKEATERSSFNKRRMSLVGVYGTASSRRALVRLPSGRYVKIKTGQKVSGWKVAAIGESSIRITKGSRDQVLRMPK